MIHLQRQVADIKQRLTTLLSEQLNLTEIQAPLIVPSDAGVQDNLSGAERAVNVYVKAEQRDYEVVHSLAKWKRSVLSYYQCEPGQGIVAQMKALRADEELLTERHSVLVEQWDWEQVIQPSERTLSTLKRTVTDIYGALRCLYQEFAPAQAQQELATQVVFVHAEQLRQMYPQLSAKQREYEFTKLHKAVFIIGIGGELADGSLHDGRAADYDDWSTLSELGYGGLNGDLLVWHPQLQDALELSSMGIRVDSKALQHQVSLRGCDHICAQPWHQQLIAGMLPECIGGGIGQSRVAMWVLQQHHISAVQAPQLVWPRPQVAKQPSIAAA